MTGPTEEGSIVARIKADPSEFNAELDKAQAKADEFSGKDTTLKVRADTGDSTAKLDRVGMAQTRLELANEALKLSYLRLDEIQQKDGEDSLKAAAGHLAAARAESAQEQATLRLAAAQGAYNAETEKSTKSTSGGGNGPGGYMGMVLAAVTALLPLLSPLAGAFAATSGAILGMGAAGVLAVLGIKNAMADGTAQGNVFAGGLHLLKGDLDQLGNTAATAMLTHFQVALSTINSYMPSLNQEIGQFSGLLGTAGNIVLSTLVSGFKILLPLFLQAGVYVEQLGTGFQKWTNDGGLAKFAHDAVSDLPLVNQALGSLVNGVISLVGAFRPLGFVMLEVINLAGEIATGLSMLGPAFVPVVGGAAAVFFAFKSWGTLGPIIEEIAWKIGLVGVSADAAAGPVGWIVGGIGLLAAALGTVAVTAQAATSATQDYTAAVQQDNGVIGENVKAQAAKALSDSGAFDSATKLGIAQKTLTNASLGSAAATNVVKAATDKYVDSAKKQAAESYAGSRSAQLASRLVVTSAKETAAAVVASAADQNAAIRKQINAYNDIATAEGLASIKTKDQLAAQTALASRYGDSLPAYLAALGANKATADQLAATTQQMVLQDDAAGLLTNALTILNGGSLSVAQAQTSLYAANNSVTDAIKANGVVIEGSTKNAVANQQAVEQQVSAAQTYAEAVGKQTGSSKAAVAAYEAQKQAIEGQLASVGALTPAMQAYLDKLYNIANLKVPPTTIDVNDAAALAALAAWDKAVANSVRTATFSLDGSIHYTNGIVTRAAGGTIYGPGSSTSDSVSARLSVGEEVINASRAGTYRPMLKAINNGSKAEIKRAAESMAGPIAQSAPAAVRMPDQHLHVYLDGKEIRNSIRQGDRALK